MMSLLQKILFCSSLLVVSSANVKQRKLADTQPLFGQVAAVETLPPTTVAPEPVYYAEGTYALDMTPFTMTVTGTPTSATMGLEEYLTQYIRGVRPSLWELSINYTGNVQVQGGYAIDYNDGFGRFMNEANPEDRLTQEEFLEYQTLLLRDNPALLNEFWAANPQYGSSLVWRGYEEGPTREEQANAAAAPEVRQTEDWVIAVVVVCIVIVITVCLFFMPRA